MIIFITILWPKFFAFAIGGFLVFTYVGGLAIVAWKDFNVFKWPVEKKLATILMSLNIIIAYIKNLEVLASAISQLTCMAFITALAPSYLKSIKLERWLKESDEDLEARTVRQKEKIVYVVTSILFVAETISLLSNDHSLASFLVSNSY